MNYCCHYLFQHSRHYLQGYVRDQSPLAWDEGVEQLGAEADLLGSGPSSLGNAKPAAGDKE